MKMTFAAYEKEMNRLRKINDPVITEDYGLTDDDINRLKADAPHYLPYIMYLASRPWYDIANDDTSKTFENPGALNCLKVAEALDEILYDNIELVD